MQKVIRVFQWRQSKLPFQIGDLYQNYEILWGKAHFKMQYWGKNRQGRRKSPPKCYSRMWRKRWIFKNDSKDDGAGFECDKHWVNNSGSGKSAKYI